MPSEAEDVGTAWHAGGGVSVVGRLWTTWTARTRRRRRAGHRVRITDEADGRARVELDGREVRRLVGYRVERGLRWGPLVTLQIRASDAEILDSHDRVRIQTLGAGWDLDDSPLLEEEIKPPEPPGRTVRWTPPETRLLRLREEFELARGGLLRRMWKRMKRRMP